MSDTSTHTTETTAERKPPTLADIVREKTDDGKRIIDFFLDVMEDRIEGAELCHRIDAAKQLEKHRSRAAARFLAEYRGVSCGHSINGRPNPADPCSAEERSLVAVTLNAPATLTQDFLTVLSGIDEFLMARLIRAQTADGGTIIDFLDDVMQDRNDGFRTHHRIAAAKELIVHIVRDEQPDPLPGEASVSVSAEAPSSVRAEPVLSTVDGSAHPELVEGSEPVVPAPTAVVPAEAGTQGGGGGRSTAANSARTEPRQIVVPAKAGTHPQTVAMGEPAPEHPEAGTQVDGGGRSTAANSARTEPVLSTAEGSQLTTNNQQLTTLKQHWHEPDPYGAPMDSTHPGRSPPW